MVIICVGDYLNANDLPGTQRDKERLASIFKNEYNYDIIGNKSSFVTYTDMENILSSAKQKFRIKSNGYKGIIVIYSGHGNERYCILSDYKGDKYDVGKYLRTDFESYFNGTNVKEKTDAFKIYFVDSCRGNTTSIMYPSINLGSKGNDDNFKMRWCHPESNKCIMYSNSVKYQSYEVPYNVEIDDIDWEIMTEDMKLEENHPTCGMFLNAVYHAFKDNASSIISFSKLQDTIRDKSMGVVPILNNFDIKVGLEIDESGNLRNKIKEKMYFTQDTDTVTKSKQNDNNVCEW